MNDARQLQAIHFRHVHVQHGQLERAAVCHGARHQLQRRLAPLGAGHAHAPAFQLLLQNVAIGLIVIHHQHTHPAQHG